MRTYLFRLLFLLGFLGGACGCSSDETEVDTDFNNLILDDNIGEKWDGTDLPSWLKERYLDFTLHESGWVIESYNVPVLCEIYRFSYKGNLLLAFTYSRFGLKQNYYYESGTLCYTNDGRRVRFEDIKSSFEKTAVLLRSNRLDDENVPQIADYGLEDIESLGWLQEAINKVCKDIQEPQQLLCRVACGYAYHNANVYIVLDYVYLDKENLAKGEIKMRNVYTLDGEKINIPENLEIKEENLCSQNITDILEYL